MENTAKRRTQPACTFDMIRTYISLWERALLRPQRQILICLYIYEPAAVASRLECVKPILDIIFPLRNDSLSICVAVQALKASVLVSINEYRLSP